MLYTRGKLQNVLKYVTKDELIAIFTKIENINMYAPKLSNRRISIINGIVLISHPASFIIK